MISAPDNMKENRMVTTTTTRLIMSIIVNLRFAARIRSKELQISQRTNFFSRFNSRTSRVLRSSQAAMIHSAVYVPNSRMITQLTIRHPSNKQILSSIESSNRPLETILTHKSSAISAASRLRLMLLYSKYRS